MKVYFAHGKESGPWGFKISRLAEITRACGCDLESIDYSDQMDPDLRVQRLLAQLRQETGEIILVGSSMGAYVSVVAAAAIEVRALFLMAPALYMPGFAVQQYQPRCASIEVVHGWSDEVIPAQNAIRFAREADCSLHLIAADHVLNGAITLVEEIYTDFLNRQLLADA